MKEKDVLNLNNHRKNGKRGLIIGLSIAVGVLGATTIGFASAYGVMQAKSNDYGIQLENVYQKNLYDLVESVNNTEIKLAKVLSANSTTYQKKLLSEIAQDSTLAESSISSLPISQNNLADSVKFINQMGGYTQTLADSLTEGKTIATRDIETLEKLHDSIIEMKVQINKFVEKLQQNYSILNQSLHLEGDFNNFTTDFSKIKSTDVDYPTMIYDGPFSDSQLDKTVKGLNGEIIDKERGKIEVEKCFKNYASVTYSGEVNSRFETWTYHVENTDSQTLYVQVSKIGGHIITVSGQGSMGSEKNITENDAKKISLDFANENGIENPEIVWQEEVDGKIYLNIAPTQNSIVLYPDLVKVKVDMGSGNVIGYDATGYFMNHVPRKLTKIAHSAEQYKSILPKSADIIQSRLVLAPLDYGREVICFEYECDYNGAKYYFYINADTGKEENILKVIETSDGNKLM